MYASVFPDPVWDATAKSLCLSWTSVGITMVWISVASSKPKARTDSSTSGIRSSSSNCFALATVAKRAGPVAVLAVHAVLEVSALVLSEYSEDQLEDCRTCKDVGWHSMRAECTRENATTGVSRDDRNRGSRRLTVKLTVPFCILGP